LIGPALRSLRRLGKQTVSPRRRWDDQFLEWIAEAEQQDRDPNDIADARWGDVRHLIERYYLPYLRPEAVVLELGPGTGRVTRHIVDRCGRLILVDFSEVVVNWIGCYLTSKGKRNFTAIHIRDCRLDPIPDESIHLAIADGVFHHIDLEDIHRYLAAFKRVLVPGAPLVINFVNLTAPEGYAKFRLHADRTDTRDVFRWHHPEVMELLFERLGFERIEFHHERVLAGDFVCYVTARKP
jgi:SAM-dependent methyltransferase